MSDSNFPFAKYNTDFNNRYNDMFNRTNYSELIKCICALTNAKSYLELGVSTGFTLFNVSKVVDKVVGVDIVDERKFKVGKFHKMTTDEFFLSCTDCFDVIFIDANHLFEFVVKDFENSLTHLSNHGILVLDDTDPLTLELCDDSRCGSAHQIKGYIYENHSELEMVTLPILCKGMSIVTRKRKDRW